MLKLKEHSTSVEMLWEGLIMLSMHRSSRQLEASKRLAARNLAEKPCNVVQYMYETGFALKSSHSQGWMPTMQLALLA